MTVSAAAEPSGREHLGTLLLVTAIAALLLSPTWHRVLFYRDLLIFNYPGIFFYKQSLLGGEMPLWCPNLFLGYPFLAELSQGAALYPLSLLHLLFAIPVSIKIFLAVHYALTGYFMWRLLREWGLQASASRFGALTWMTSGYLVSQHLNLGYLAPAIWYPGLLFCWHRLLVRPRLAWLLAAGFGWALLLLGGDPQACVFAGILLFLYALCFRRQAAGLRLSLPLLAAAGALALLLVLAQLLPGLELAASGPKLQGFDFALATSWSHHPLRLLEWIWPGLWGPIFPSNHFWGHLWGMDSIPWAGTVYLGLFPLLLALQQCRHFRQPLTGFLVLVFGLFLLMALGRYSPLFRLVWTGFPPYRLFRYPEKHLAVASFALAGLAACGFQRLLAPEAETARRDFFRSFSWFTAFLVAAGLAMLISINPLAAFLSDYLRRVEHFPFSPYLIRDSLLPAFLRAPLVAAAFLVVWRLSRRAAFVSRRLAFWLLALTAADLITLGRAQFAVTDPSLYTFEPAAARLIRRTQAGKDELFHVFRSDRILPPLNLTRPAAVSEPERTPFWKRDTLLSNLTLTEGFQELFGYDPAELGRFQRLGSQTPDLALLQMLNVKYLLDGLSRGERQEAPELDPAGQDPESNLRLWRLRDYFPRAFFVDGVRPARDETESFAFLSSTDFRRQVILLQSSRPDLVAGSTFVPARVLSYRNRRVEVEVNAPGSGHLILSDTNFPGWEAAVDGRPARILRANYLVRAVALEPGRHQVVFSYRPWPWRIGATASLVSLLWLALLLCRRTVAGPGDRCQVGIL